MEQKLTNRPNRWLRSSLPMLVIVAAGCSGAAVEDGDFLQVQTKTIRFMDISSEIPQELLVSIAPASTAYEALVNSGIDLSATGRSVVDDVFGEGDQLGVYYTIDGQESPGFVALWFDSNTMLLMHVIIGRPFYDKDTINFHLEIDGVHSEDVVSRADSSLSGEGKKAQGLSSGQLPQCLVACRGGYAARMQFCRAIPHPYVRAACWSIGFVSVVACNGWCYWNF